MRDIWVDDWINTVREFGIKELPLLMFTEFMTLKFLESINRKKQSMFHDRIMGIIYDATKGLPVGGRRCGKEYLYFLIVQEALTLELQKNILYWKVCPEHEKPILDLYLKELDRIIENHAKHFARRGNNGS